jgi:hypothetical protein
MVQTLLTAAGTVLSLVGIACAVVAYQGTWQEHGDGPLYPRIASWLARARFRVRRIFGRSPGVVVGVGAAVAAAASASGRMTVTGPAIPSDADLDRKVELLIRRVENIEREAADDRSHQAREVMALREEIDKTSSNAAQMAAEIDAKAKFMVLGSIRLQLFGLGLVGAGTVLLSLAGFMA